MIETRICPMCGKKFTVPSHSYKKKYCSKECAHKGTISHLPKRICVLCGKEFTPKGPNALICEDVHYRTCPICGKKFVVNRDHIDVKTCSKECQWKLTAQTNTEKYGGKSPMASAKVQETHKKVMKEKYGVEHALQSEELKQRAVETNQKKFGTDWALGNKEFHDRCEDTMEKKYGEGQLGSLLCSQRSTIKRWRRNMVEEPFFSQRCSRISTRTR